MITQETYRIVEGNRVMSVSSRLPMFLRDKHWEGFSKDDIRTVFEYSYTELQEKARAFHDLSRTPSQAEERELVFLLEALLKSRKLLDERFCRMAYCPSLY
jgi:hypothetical protein